MSKRLFVGVFENEQDTLGAIRASRKRGFKIVDVYAPYAVHGVEEAMELPPSRLPWIVFALGLLGAGLKVWFEFWTTAVDWPLNVGGKPFNSLPAFVPVTFEVMVLCLRLWARCSPSSSCAGSFLESGRFCPCLASRTTVLRWCWRRLIRGSSRLRSRGCLRGYTLFMWKSRSVRRCGDGTGCPECIPPSDADRIGDGELAVESRPHTAQSRVSAPDGTSAAVQHILLPIQISPMEGHCSVLNRARSLANSCHCITRLLRRTHCVRAKS